MKAKESWEVEADNREQSRKATRRKLTKEQRATVDELLDTISAVLTDCREFISPRIDDLSKMEVLYWKLKRLMGKDEL